MKVQFCWLAWDNLSRECPRKVLPILCSFSLLPFSMCWQCSDGQQNEKSQQLILQGSFPASSTYWCQQRSGNTQLGWGKGAHVCLQNDHVHRGDFSRQPCTCCCSSIPNQLFKQYLEQILELLFALLRNWIDHDSESQGKEWIRFCIILACLWFFLVFTLWTE